MAWPETKLDLLVEMYLAGAWTDVTADVYGDDRGGITITRGRSSEAGSLEPARCSLEINNADGTYSPRNPRSPYYGTFGRNTPLRVWARGTETYLWVPFENNGGERARTASSASLDITTDLDVRIELALDRIPTLSSTYAAQSNEVVARYNATGTPGNRSWRLLLDNLGQPTLTWSTDGDDFPELGADQPVPYVSGERFALRATLDVDNGASGHTATFYTASSLDGPWEQLGEAQVGSGTTSIHAPGDASLEVGDINTIAFSPGWGRYYGMELYDGIDGTLLASPDFTAQAHGTTAFNDAQSNPWQVVNGAEITHFYRRFAGEVAEFPTRWVTGGFDVWTELEAAGVLRRLSQGAAPLKSTLRRRIPSASPAPLAYWPMEEGEEATRAFSPIDGVLPMETRDLTFGADSTMPASAPLPTLGDNARIRGYVPGATAGGWHVEMVYKLDALPASTSTVLQVTVAGSQITTVRMRVDTSQTTLELLDSEDTVLGSVGFADPDSLEDFVGTWNRLQLFTSVNGSDTYVSAAWRDVGNDNFWFIRTTVANTDPGAITSINTTFPDDLQGMGIGHISAFDVGGTFGASLSFPAVDIYADADDGFADETAFARVRRLAAEEDLPLIATGAASGSQAMGPQRIASVLDNVTDCEEVDGGLLIEQRETIGLAYIGRDMFYNPVAGLELDYTATGEVMPPLEPTDDDRLLRNDRTVQRDGGSSARAVLEEGRLSVQPPPDGAGVYDDSVTLNLNTDAQAEHIAHWRLHLGTVDEARYPIVTVNLRTAPHLIPSVLSLDVGSTITIANPPAWLPPGLIRLRVEGWTERLNAFEWTIQFVCSPGTPWVVGQVALEDGTDGTDKPNRLDTDESQLATAATAEGTSLLVHTVQEAAADHAVWVTTAGPGTLYPTEVPFDVELGGETVRVTAVQPGVWDSFTRTETAAWGTSASGAAWALSGGTATDFDVTGTAGTIQLAADQATLRFAEIDTALGDCEQLTSVSVDTLPAAGEFLPGLFARGTDASGSTEIYWLNLALDAAGAVHIEVRKTVTVVGTRQSTGHSYSAGTVLWLRMRVVGHRVLGRVWPDGNNEPDSWDVDQTIVDTVDTGTFGIAVASTDGTSTTPTFSFDDYELVTPQEFTVTRSVNGISKAHASGTDVRLAQPMIIAL
ncbi:hypothetical protein RM572_00335 [Streptomyces sp. DSM 42041]|uniref:Uncharacterized protein n=1 Tax=Streptomyces hazeniae TaxID=3075538 RepID=A0ABU2NNJ7_9ACTN|nr:hypothetical protein [Streptomyces sp. DSM 42041]MDT0377223.1 hypothetical protein [Streptomyces sp. DSM 42041]